MHYSAEKESNLSCIMGILESASQGVFYLAARGKGLASRTRGRMHIYEESSRNLVQERLELPNYANYWV